MVAGEAEGVGVEGGVRIPKGSKIAVACHPTGPNYSCLLAAHMQPPCVQGICP